MVEDQIADSLMHQAATAEGFACTLYTIYATAFREQGYTSAAMLLDEMAQNEKEHMEQWIKRLDMLETPDIIFENGVMGERRDTEFYRRMSEHSDVLPDEVLELASNLRTIEEHHAKMLAALYQQYKTGQAPTTTRYLWVCPHCGNIYESEDEIPDVCPVCGHEKRDYVYREVIA